jgi:hypothetical protein
MTKCKHNNGWISIDEFCVGIDTTTSEDYDYQLVAKFRCNNLNCKKIKVFRFAIDNFKEIK